MSVTNNVNEYPTYLLDRYDVFGLDPNRSCTITAIVTTTTGKEIQIVWNYPIQTLDDTIFDFELFLDYVTDRTHLYVTDLVLYVPHRENTHRIRGNIQYTGAESSQVNVTDLTVNAKNAVGLYSVEFASTNTHTHDIDLANVSHSTAVPDEYVPLLNASQQETELKTLVYKYPFEEVPWSVRSPPSAYERFDKFSDRTLTGRITQTQALLYRFDAANISEDSVLWFASLDPNVVAVIHTNANNRYDLYDQTVGVENRTTDPNTTLFTRKQTSESESESKPDTQWVLDYEVDWDAVNGSVPRDTVMEMHANVSAYVMDRGNVATYANPVYSPKFDVPLVELTESESFVPRVHRFRYDLHALFSGNDEYRLTNPADAYPILANGELTLFQFEYSETEQTTCTLHHGSEYTVFLLTDKTNQLSINVNLWHNMNVKNNGANVAYANLEGDRVGAMIMRHYVGADDVDLTLPPKSVLFVTPTMYTIDTEHMSDSQKRYVTFPYEGNVYHVVQYQTPDLLRYTFNDALDQTDLRTSSLVEPIGLSILQTSPFKEPDSEPFGVVFALTNDADLLDDNLLIVPSDPGRYSFVEGRTPYTIARPPRTPFFADFVFGDDTSVAGLTVRPDGSQTVFANVVYESTIVDPFFADFVFGDDTSVAGLTVRPDGSHTVLVHEEDLYVKPPVDPFFADFSFGDDTSVAGLTVRPDGSQTVFANVVYESTIVDPFFADFVFGDDTSVSGLTVRPDGSHTVLVHEEDLYVKPPVDPFFADFSFGDDTSVSGLTVRPDGSHTVLVHEEDLYVKPPVDPFFADFSFGDDTSVSGLTVRPDGSHTVLVHEEDLYVKPPVDPFFADFVFGDDTSVAGLTVRPDGSHTVLVHEEDLYVKPPVDPFFADFVFGDDTSVAGLTVRPDGSHTVLVHEEDLYVKPPVDPFFADFVFGDDTSVAGLTVRPDGSHTVFANVYAEPILVVSYTADYTFDDGTILTVHPVTGSQLVFSNAYAEPLDPPTFSVSYTMTDQSSFESNWFVSTTTEYTFVSKVYVFAT
jgi:hypothetical protein